MDFDKIAKEITDRIEKFKNKEKINWRDVYTKELNKLVGFSNSEKDLVLIRVVREISKRGYTIEDEPFKLTR